MLELNAFESTKYGYNYKMKINFCVRGVKPGILEKNMI